MTSTPATPESRSRGGILAIPRAELPFAISMSLYLFLVIATFWILKPIKKSLFIQFYDEAGLHLLGWTLNAAQAELIAKMLNMVVAFAAVVVFTTASRRLRREQLTYLFTAAFAVSFVFYALVLGSAGAMTVWTFYWFGDLFSTLMVATFFTFLNDSVTPPVAKRIYGLVVLGGVVGGVAGSTGVHFVVDAFSPAACLWLCLGLAALIVACAWQAARRIPADARKDDASQKHEARGAAPEKGDAAPTRNAALEGAALAWRSPYLLAVVAIVGLYEIVSTLMDFQFTSTVAHLLDGEAIGKHFSTMFAITNAVSMVVQLFVTTPVLTHLGVGVALLVLPGAAMLGSSVFLAAPTLWTGSLLNTADNAFSYSINQSAKEVLYVPTTRDEKYKAKAFIDMFVVRTAKAIAVLVSLGMGVVFSDFDSVRWISLITLALLGAWVAAAVYAGRKFRELTGGR